MPPGAKRGSGVPNLPGFQDACLGTTLVNEPPGRIGYSLRLLGQAFGKAVRQCSTQLCFEVYMRE